MCSRLRLIPRDMVLFHKMRGLRHESSVMPLDLGATIGVDTSMQGAGTASTL